MTFTKVEGLELKPLLRLIQDRLDKSGYKCRIYNNELRNFRLNDNYIKDLGYNISPYTRRRGRILSWNNWLLVNCIVNEICNDNYVSANIKTLGNKFTIRQGKTEYREKDWLEQGGYDNVGSIINPCYRIYGWQSERS